MIEWNLAKIKYITTPISKAELAKELGVSWKTVHRHAIEGNWEAERMDFGEEIADKILADAKKQADGCAQKISDTAEMMVDGIKKLMDSGMIECPRDYKSLSSALADLKAVIGAKGGEETDNRVRVEFVGLDADS